MGYTKIKIDVNRKSRKGNNRPTGVVIIQVPQETSMKHIDEAMKVCSKAFNDAATLNKIPVMVIPDTYKIQFISLK